MANVLINENTMTDIADAIREKLGVSDTYKPAEMPDAIASISGGGNLPTAFAPIVLSDEGTVLFMSNPKNGGFDISTRGYVDGVEYGSPLIITPELDNKTLVVTAAGEGFESSSDTVQLQYVPHPKLMVATTNGTEFAYSADGVNWTKVSLPETGIYYATISRDNKIFISKQGAKTAYLYDLSQLESIMLPNAYNTYAGCYGKGLFVISCANTSYSFKSADLRNWTRINFPATGYLTSIAYGNLKYVACDLINSRVIVSENGADWKMVTTPVSGRAHMSFCHDRFIIYHENKQQLSYSFDGENWFVQSIPYVISSQEIDGCYGNGKYVIWNGNSILYSDDFVNWNVVSMSDSALNGGFINGKFVRATNSAIFYSDDLENWTKSIDMESILTIYAG